MKKFKITKGNRVYIVDAKSHIDAISKVKAVKTDEVRDSISQWKPGMSEIGLFQISYKKGTVYQSILVKAATKEDAINKFTKHKPDAEVIGVNEYPNPHFGEPILDSSVKDGSYGTLNFSINSLDDITLTNLVKYIRDQFTQKWDKKIKEIITADVSNAYDSAKLSLSFKEKDDNSWTFSTATLNVRPSTSLIEKYYKDNGTYAEKKLIADIVKKLKQYSNKTIYKNNTITDGSAIKDAYIEEWWGQSGENPNTVARRYGVSVKQLKRNNDQILYRFEGDIDKLNRMHSDGYFMSIDMAGNSIKDGNNQLSAPKNLRVGSRIQTRNGTYTIIAIDNNDIATIQYENGRKFKLALYDIIDELDNVYTTKIIK